jgi:hypothetical protein
MRVDWDKKTGLPTFKVEDKDFYDVIQIQEMMKGAFQCRTCGTNYESSGWQILQGYFESARLKLEEEGKKHAESRMGREKCATDFAKLAGFDYFRATPSIVVRQMEVMKEALIKQEEIKNAGRPNDEDY